MGRHIFEDPMKHGRRQPSCIGIISGTVIAGEKFAAITHINNSPVREFMEREFIAFRSQNRIKSDFSQRQYGLDALHVFQSRAKKGGARRYFLGKRLVFRRDAPDRVGDPAIDKR
jgi:hypothetical protein